MDGCGRLSDKRLFWHLQDNQIVRVEEMIPRHALCVWGETLGVLVEYVRFMVEPMERGVPEGS